ncbi:MAG TPA: AbrB/MazE/SpoVT family DNA-binding domain-containing protein [Methyloceanibacter sp.]|nr:AbrB/MazE/SpoVT family DNA-binding domain-containing protein [Methyloceanibacter sp.]
MKIEIKRIGNSTGLILPKELLAKLQLKQGDVLFVTELAEGGIKLAPHDPTFERGMEIARKAMKTYRNTLRELAK